MPKPLNLVLSLLLALVIPAQSVFCAGRDEFKKKALSLKWIAYAPANFDPERGVFPSEDSVRKDLELLYGYGFRGIVTYGSDRILGDVPRLAREAGFSGVIMGVWNLESEEELANALKAREYVDAYCIGNEGLGHSYGIDRLRRVIVRVKAETGKPAATTEQVNDYYRDDVLTVGDWIFPNIHPFLSNVKDPKKAASWIKKYYGRLQKKCPPDKFILFKEVGYPTAGDAYAKPANQADFFHYMEQDSVAFVYFEAFDQKWKRHLPVEPYWGLFNYKRKPKKYILSLFEGTRKSLRDNF